MAEITAFWMGVMFKSLAGYLFGDLIVKPLLKRWVDRNPLHVQPFTHYLESHEGKPEDCPLCRLT